MFIAAVAASCVATMWVRWSRRRRAAQGVPHAPIADRDVDDLHRIDGGTVRSRNTGRLRAPSESGVVRLARGSVPPPLTARGEIVIPRPRRVSPSTGAAHERDLDRS